MDDKLLKLLQALDTPGYLSDDQINVLLEDEEAREMYSLISKTADASATASEPDIDKEWERFSTRNLKPRRPPFRLSISNFLRRNAAAAVVAVGATIAVAATVGITYTLTQREVTEEKAEPTQMNQKGTTAYTEYNELEKNPESQEAPASNVSVFKNETLDTIVESLARYYNLSVAWKREDAKDLRLFFEWDKNLPVNEVVMQLNSFNRINIEVSRDTLIVN